MDTATALLPPGRLLPTPGPRPLTGTRNWRQARDASVIYLPHPLPCDGCHTTMRELVDATAQLDLWAARPVFVLRDAPERLGVPATLGRFVALDPDGRTRRACGLADDDAAVMIADRFGEVWESQVVGDDHAAPTHEQIISTVRYIAIQCPECETPDSPALDRLP